MPISLRFISPIAAFLILSAVSLELSAAPLPTNVVWRAQLYIKVCDKKNASTDDNVFADLSEVNRTYLDYARDDFQRDSQFTYDLVLENISSFRDITKLRLAKSGSNGTCVQTLRLLINGKKVYEKIFSSRWLDGDHRSINVSRQELEADPNWKAYLHPLLPPTRIGPEELESRIESIVGTIIHKIDPPGGKIVWNKHGPEAVSVTRKDADTDRVDLDLKYALNNLPDEDIDIDFDLDVSCSNGIVDLQIHNYHVSVDSPWYAEVFSLGISQLLDLYVEWNVKKALQAMTISITPGFCPRSLGFTSDGALVVFL